MPVIYINQSYTREATTGIRSVNYLTFIMRNYDTSQFHINT